MIINSPVYGQIDVGPLEMALYEAVADDLGDVTAEEVALVLLGRHLSDGFYAAYDNEVADLRRRFLDQRTAE